MDARLRELVRQRAGDRCEYCRLRQQHDRFHTFHVEHIVARQHRGSDGLENLAWACHQCNAHKGTNLATFDPDTNEVVRLFHPRLQQFDLAIRVLHRRRHFHQAALQLELFALRQPDATSLENPPQCP